MVNIPSEHMEVVNKTSIFIQQFSLFMNGENSSIIIRNEEEYSNAAVVIKSVKDHKKLIGVSKDEVVKPVYDEYKEKLAVFTEQEKLIDTKISALESAGRVYRKKVEDEARERQRLADLAAEAERRKAETEANKAKEKAQAYTEQGRTDKAEEWASKAESKETVANSIVAPIIKAEIPKNTRGSFNTRKSYAARIFNYQQIMDHLKVDCPESIKAEIQKWANAQARAAAGSKSTLPGVEFYEV